MRNDKGEYVDTIIINSSQLLTLESNNNGTNLVNKTIKNGKII